MIRIRSPQRSLDREYKKVAKYYDNLVDEIGTPHARNVSKALMAETMEPFAVALRAASPVREGNLRRSVRVKAFATRPTKRRGVLIGARAGYTSNIKGRKYSPRKAREGQFLGLEFGTKYIRPKGIMRRVVESQRETVIRSVGTNLAKLQAMSAKSLSRKTSEIRTVLK